MWHRKTSSCTKMWESAIWQWKVQSYVLWSIRDDFIFVSLKAAKLHSLKNVKRWTAPRETWHVVKAWERQTDETNSSRGIDLQGQQPLHKHHSLRTSSCYETPGRHELGLFWQLKRVSGQGGESGRAFSLEIHLKSMMPEKESQFGGAVVLQIKFENIQEMFVVVRERVSFCLCNKTAFLSVVLVL